MGSYREFKKEAMGVLTRKHFVDIADILVKHNASDDMIWDFANYFQRGHTNFDYELFMDYVSKQKEVSVEPSAELNEEIEEGGLNV